MSDRLLSKMPRPIVAMAGVLLALAFAGCSRSASLPDAYYAENMVPVYPHSQLSDQMGSDSYGDGPDEKWDGMAWWFSTPDDPDKIVAFYQAKLAGWQKDTDESGVVTFKTVPPDGDVGEEVYVRIDLDGKYMIGESVKSTKKAHKQT